MLPFFGRYSSTPARESIDLHTPAPYAHPSYHKATNSPPRTDKAPYEFSILIALHYHSGAPTATRIKTKSHITLTYLTSYITLQRQIQQLAFDHKLVGSWQPFTWSVWDSTRDGITRLVDEKAWEDARWLALARSGFAENDGWPLIHVKISPVFWGFRVLPTERQLDKAMSEWRYNKERMLVAGRYEPAPKLAPADEGEVR